MPDKWPPRVQSRVGEHFRRHLATYVLGGIAIGIVGGGVGFAVVLSRLSEIREIVSAR